jgi:5-(carboxyamino)imidazole ribonucleotide mutase
MLVAIITGSDSDLKTMQGTVNTLEKLEIPYQVSVLSAHRCTEEVLKYIKEIEKKGFEVIIAAAGKAAHLPGVIAANTSIPVIGVPIETPDLGGLDSLLSIVQMPKDVPVATVAIGSAGAVNAAVLALKILGIKHPSYRKKADEYRERVKNEAISRNSIIREVGFHKYLEKYL